AAQKIYYVVWKMREAHFPTSHKKLSERRRREQAMVMESRQIFNKEEEYMPEAVIVSAVRTPIGRANKGVLKDVRGDDLAAFAVKAAVERVPKLDRSLIEDVIIGCAFPEGEQGMNLARIVGALAGLPETAGGVTVNR